MSAPGGGSRSVLVTGATGVVGRRAIPRLVALGHRVTAIGRTAEKRAWLESQGARALALDLFDAAAVRRAVESHHVEVVVNLATHMPSSSFKMMLPWSWKENDRVRRDGSATLVDASLEAGVRRFVQESFGPVYEAAGEAWIDESRPMRPTALNRTILDAESSAERFTGPGRDGVVLRFAGFYGPDPLLRDMVRVVRKGWSPLPGPDEAYWSAISQDDAAAAVVAAIDLSAGIYNVCDDEPLTRRELAGVLAAAAGAPVPRPIPGWMAALGGPTTRMLSRSVRMSNAKLKGASEWTPRWRSAREGLPAVVEELGEAVAPAA